MAETVIATSTEMENHFDRFLNAVMHGEQIIITMNGKKVARVVPETTAVSVLTDSLTGILKESGDLKKEKDKALPEKYKAAD